MMRGGRSSSMIGIAGALAAAIACGGESASSQRSTAATVPIRNSPVGPVAGAREPAASPDASGPSSDKLVLADGRRYFVSYNCAGCHGDHGGGGMGPSLRDTTWIYGGAHDDIADTIIEGRAYGMPSWGTMLTPEQVQQIAAYIKSLRTPEEPEPPGS